MVVLDERFKSAIELLLYFLTYHLCFCFSASLCFIKDYLSLSFSALFCRGPLSKFSMAHIYILSFFSGPFLLCFRACVSVTLTPVVIPNQKYHTDSSLLCIITHRWLAVFFFFFQGQLSNRNTEYKRYLSKKSICRLQTLFWLVEREHLRYTC